MGLDRPFKLLRAAERRIILRELTARGGAATLETLAATAATRLPDRDVEAAQIRLHHVDLPKLEDAGLISYDYRSGDVVLHETATELKPYLDLADDDTAPPILQ